MAGASGKFVIRMESGLHEALRRAASESGMSLNDYCVRRLASAGTGGADAAAVVTHASSVCGAHLQAVAIFGSWARGTAAAGSDVDVLIVVDEALPVTRALYTAWDRGVTLTWDGHAVEPHLVQLPSTDARISGLWAEVSLDAVVLFDRGYALSRHLVRVRREIVAGSIVQRWSGGQPYWVAA